MVKKLTVAQKYSQLKKHTENAGMKVSEKDGKIIVSDRENKTQNDRKVSNCVPGKKSRKK